MPDGSFNDYLTEIGRHPVLSPEAQLRHCQRIHAWVQWPEGRDAAPPKVARAGRRSMDAMVRTNLRLVVNIAGKYQNRGLEMNDLIQEGNIGLIRGLELYDPARGYAVSTYTYWWIRQAITRALHTHSRTIRLPINVHETMSRVLRFQGEYASKNGHAPSVEEISQHVKVKPDRLRLLIDQYAITQAISYDALINDDTTMLDCLGGPDPMAELDSSDTPDITTTNTLVENALSCLSENEALVLREHHFKGRTLGSIGEDLGVSRSRAGQLLQSAVRRVRMHIALNRHPE